MNEPREREAVCRRLRTKMYYVMGRDHVDLSRSSGTAQYWCARTTTVLGPDDVFCSPEMCHAGRACFEDDQPKPSGTIRAPIQS